MAAITGFIGNELVAVFRIRTGKEIGSAALVADGYHARTDGFTSLAVLGGAIGVWLGYPLLDPIIGLGIGAAILVIVWNSGRNIWLRMMDAVDPEVTAQVEHEAGEVDGVMSVHDTAIRWVGHRRPRRAAHHRGLRSAFTASLITSPKRCVTPSSMRCQRCWRSPSTSTRVSAKDTTVTITTQSITTIFRRRSQERQLVEHPSS